MYSINSSQETFMTEYGVPEGVTTTNIPYDGTPFSAYTVLTRGGKTLRVQFGVGGYYADTAAKYIKDFFSDTEVPDTTHQRSKGATILTKDSPEVQDLLVRIQQEVPGLTGPVGNLWEYEYNGYRGIEITYDQEPPTAMLREFRPGHYGLVVVYLPHEDHRHDTHRGEHNDETSPPVWEAGDYGCGQWFIPVTDSDRGLIEALQA